MHLQSKHENDRKVTNSSSLCICNTYIDHTSYCIHLINYNTIPPATTGAIGSSLLPTDGEAMSSIPNREAAAAAAVSSWFPNVVRVDQEFKSPATAFPKEVRACVRASCDPVAVCIACGG